MNWLWNAEPLQTGRLGRRALFRLLWCGVGAVVWAILLLVFPALRDVTPVFIWYVLIFGPAIMAVIGYCVDVLRYRRILPKP